MMTSGGKRLVRFQVMDSRKSGTEFVNQYLNCVCTGDAADRVANLEDKQRVEIRGSLQINSYEKDGVKKSSTDIFCFEVTPIYKEGEADHRSAASGETWDNTPVNDDIAF
jgi:hypothetical protein